MVLQFGYEVRVEVTTALCINDFDTAVQRILNLYFILVNTLFYFTLSQSNTLECLLCSVVFTKNTD